MPKPRLQRDLERLTQGIAALRIVHSLIAGKPIMAGEIRDALWRFKLAHERMTQNIVAEMDKATALCPTVEKEGIAAARLPAATVAQTRAEIRDIHAEFSVATNGGPDGPLPGNEQSSEPPSADSAPPPLPPSPDSQTAEKKTIAA